MDNIKTTRSEKEMERKIEKYIKDRIASLSLEKTETGNSNMMKQYALNTAISELTRVLKYAGAVEMVKR